MRVTTLDYHTAGEPLRIVTGGLPEVRGESMLAKRRFMQDNLDHYRRFLMLEPRGHADMYGAVLTEPVTPDGDVGVLFLHNQGYSTMCGHGIIALVTAGMEQTLFDIPDPGRVCIDTPAGRITARANLGADGQTESVSFLNVPSFVLLSDCELEIEGRKVSASIAFGGAFYAYLDAGDFGLELVPSEASRIIRLGREIKDRCNRKYAVRHPVGDADLNFLYGTIFVNTPGPVNRSRNVCVFADGELDRSPTGTGVSGRAAIHYALGQIGLDETLEIESIIGTRFRVRCVEETTQGRHAAVVTEVTGSAHIFGKQQFILDERDTLPDGFLLR